jgi:hypothetical protein
VNGVRADGRRLWPGAPERTFAALGYNNNRLIVIPEWRMVIVRLGEDAGDRTLTDDAQSEFIARVGRAFTDGTPAAGTAAAPAPSLPHSSAPRPPDGDGAVAITGELKQWHKVTLTIDGPFARERDEEPNPFTDYRLTIAFTHESGAPRYAVPGYFAADGNAAHSSAEAGTRWRAHLAPDRAGKWTYAISFRRGKDAAVSDAASEPVSGIDGKTGEFTIAATDKTGRDFRSRGRLEYSGRHHLRFAGTGEYFLKAGADSPETLLACTDFDGTAPGRSTVRRAGEARPEPALHRYEPHVQDWRDGDPTWKDGKGKGLIGALNYLAAQGLNAVSFLPYNAGGDGDNVWPFTGRGDRLHYDCSKLDQWGLVFDHATALGLFLHFKLQETEMDDQRTGHQAEPAVVPEALDGGRLGQERKLYCRELVARFGHALALNWNLGEENTQTTEEQRDMIRYLAATDPYRHPIVIHTFPDQQDQVYTALLGEPSQLAGTSLQNAWDQTHERVLKWRRESARAGRPWVVASDEQGPASDGVPVDPGYAGRDGFAGEGAAKYNLDGIRKLTLWGNLMAGGAGVEYYFGYQQPQNDLGCEDFRSRERSWSYCRIALEFFREHRIPFWEMAGADALLGDPAGGRRKFCLAREGEFYLVYLPDGGTSELDLSAAKRSFRVAWFNPRAGGPLAEGSVQSVAGGGRAAIGLPPAGGAAGEDWLAVIR